MKFKSHSLAEPVLVFGHDGKHTDPKAGLAAHGPAGHLGGGQVPISVTLGFVGPSESVETARQWILTLNDLIDPENANVRLFPPFPGMPVALNARLVAPDSLVYEIPPRQLSEALLATSHKKKVVKCSDAFAEGFSVLAGKAGPPNVVVCAWSEAIVDGCAGTIRSMRMPTDLRHFRDYLMEQEDAGQQRLMPLDPEAKELLETGRSSWNLHAQLKSQAMETGLPIQVLMPRTFRGESQKEDPLTPWNLATGLYYKAGGVPWKPADSEPDTCYIGIEFYRDKTTPERAMRTCLAQIFSDQGQGLVLRGSRFRLPSEGRRSPRMDEDTTSSLLSDAIALYEKHNRRRPRRVVVHKSSHFVRPEIKGAESAFREIESYDLVTIQSRTGVQFVRRGTQPPLRGTMILLDAHRFALFTSGYIPYVHAYPGPRIPRPLVVIHHGGPSGPLRLGTEILKLSKLNWNTARFSGSLPSTLGYADFVKSVLAQTQEEQEVSENYSSYM